METNTHTVHVFCFAEVSRITALSRTAIYDHWAQRDSAPLEARAKIRLADEYDAAQERREVAKVEKPSIVGDSKNTLSTTTDLGISRYEIHEARSGTLNGSNRGCWRKPCNGRSIQARSPPNPNSVGPPNE